MKILIAEDNRFYRNFVEATVTGWGYEVVSANDGVTAWRILLEKDAPSLAILDWLMPGISGLELCQRVRALNRPRPTYLIMLTAKSDKADVLAALRNGADDYIAKPFDADELHARLQVGLRIVGLQASLAERVGVLETALFESQKIEAVGRLAGGIAHDFNNLLTVVKGYSELLLRVLPPGEGSHTFAATIRDAADRGATLTRQILAFARKQVLNPAVINLNTCVSNVEKMLRDLIGENVRVAVELEPELQPVEADAGQVEQVLMNLLLNARDAMPDGGKVTITTANALLDETPPGESPANPGGGYAMVSVVDTGCGMSETTKSHLFEPFFTTKEIGKGTGLGLATAYGIVKQSGGFIRVESEVGHGSTFRVYLPWTAQAVPQPDVEAPAGPSEPGSETVLLVEDEDRVRVLLNSVLTLHGYTVLEAANGEEALCLSRQHELPIDLLVTDVVMPGISGYETARRLTALRPGLRVLFISGYSEDAISLQRAAGPSASLLQKPFTPEELVVRVRTELARRRCVATRYARHSSCRFNGPGFV